MPAPQRVVVLLALDDDATADRFGAVAAAAAIAAGSDISVTALLVGRAPDEDAAEHAFAAGAHEVLLLAQPALAAPVQTDQLVELMAAAIAQQPSWQDEAGLFLLPAGPVGEEIAARLAARLDGIALGRCLDIALAETGLLVRRAAFGGRAELVLEAAHRACFAAMRHAGNAHAAPHGTVRQLQLATRLPGSDHIRHVALTEDTPRLDGARIIVAGGRGMDGEDGFRLLRELAACLGAALGGSLPTIDAGWLPVSRQIGQSGHFVAPELYVAVAISGTPQHMAGIGPHTRIIAVNRDPDAEIFRHASIGVVADWKELLPALLSRLRSGP
jgi:electron transfer flavoprotein alpha subunit